MTIIDAADFDSPQSLGAHIAYLVANRSAYEEYHAWRRKPPSEDFLNRFDFARVLPPCRACRWAHAQRERRATALRMRAHGSRGVQKSSGSGGSGNSQPVV